MAAMVDVICKCGCGTKFQARVADVKRGWGKYYNKSHKAKQQEKHTGQYAAHKAHVQRDDIADVDYDDGGCCANITIDNSDTEFGDEY